MENYLAIDTSGDSLTVVAVQDGKVFERFIGDCAMKHSITLMNQIDELLTSEGLALSAFDFFACVVGAGSFTGIRIGISVVKGFALALKKPMLPVTSFDMLAYNGVDNGCEQKTLCLVDALHDCYYACGYEKGEQCVAPCYLTEEEALAYAAQGYRLRAGAVLPIAQKADVEVVALPQGLQNAVEVLAEKQAFGELVALYVRKSSAEINLEKGA